MILKVIYPFTYTYSLENLTNNPLNDFKSSGSRWILSNTFYYSMYAELPWSTRTLLISQSSHLTVMTLGSSLWGWMPIASFSEKVIATSSVWPFPSVLTSVRFSTLKIWRVYLLRAEMVSPPPVNPSTMVLSVWHKPLLPFPWWSSLALLGQDFQIYLALVG